jgi:thioredoxin-dependent peroxiredoxin
MTNRLEAGQDAPTFSKTDLRGDKVDLPELLKSKPVWLGFFRFALCPLCNLRVHQMVGTWKRYEPLCHFVAVFQSPPEAFEGFITKHSPPFFVITDPQLEMYSTYAIEKSLLKAVFHPKNIGPNIQAMKEGWPSKPTDPKHGAALRIPADFIIARTGKLAAARYGGFVSDSMPFDEAENVLKGIQ